ncbi:DUF2268 domain-containing protein [Psychrobacillus vulpis]|nr:DUF2268 domain-containing putative Zn-dependent protease [Psychrobacillus vulpis]
MKKLSRFFIAICFSFLLFGCSDKTESAESSTKQSIQSPLVFQHNEQEFKVYTYYEEFENFLESAKKQPDNLDALYTQAVVEAFRSNPGYAFLEDNWMLTTPTDIEELEKTIDALIDKQKLITDSIVAALKESADRLPGGNKSVYLLPFLPEFKPDLKVMNYVTGEAWNKNTIIITIDPLFLVDDLQYTIAHEYHHVVAMEYRDSYTLLERSVLEGKADAFAKMVYPNVQVPWIEPLTGYSEEQGRKLFIENLDSTDTGLWYEFFKGNHYRGLDVWSNYKIGHEIMEGFLEKNPDVPVEEWTQMPAEDILLKSEYKDK